MILFETRHFKMSNSVVAFDTAIGSNVSIGKNCIIHPTARISNNVSIGDFTVICEFTSIQCNIGDHNYIDTGACIYAPIGSYNYIGMQVIVDSPLYNYHTIRHRQHVAVAKAQSVHPKVDNIENAVKYCKQILPKHLKLK
eukprot:NODE_6_length_48303_cov_0.387022.p20 type:complete len:140 gc:universal NODE_6_length_48303_cov_0.387022:47773-47354(-)